MHSADDCWRQAQSSAFFCVWWIKLFLWIGKIQLPPHAIHTHSKINFLIVLIWSGQNQPFCWKHCGVWVGGRVFEREVGRNVWIGCEFLFHRPHPVYFSSNSHTVHVWNLTVDIGRWKPQKMQEIVWYHHQHAKTAKSLWRYLILSEEKKKNSPKVDLDLFYCKFLKSGLRSFLL